MSPFPCDPNFGIFPGEKGLARGIPSAQKALGAKEDHAALKFKFIWSSCGNTAPSNKYQEFYHKRTQRKTHTLSADRHKFPFF